MKFKISSTSGYKENVRDLLYENKYNKKIKVTIKDDNSITTYTEVYKKVFNEKFINGFIWVIV